MWLPCLTASCIQANDKRESLTKLVTHFDSPFLGLVSDPTSRPRIQKPLNLAPHQARSSPGCEKAPQPPLSTFHHIRTACKCPQPMSQLVPMSNLASPFLPVTWRSEWSTMIRTACMTTLGQSHRPTCLHTYNYSDDPMLFPVVLVELSLPLPCLWAATKREPPTFLVLARVFLISTSYLTLLCPVGKIIVRLLRCCKWLVAVLELHPSSPCSSVLSMPFPPPSPLRTLDDNLPVTRQVNAPAPESAPQVQRQGSLRQVLDIPIPMQEAFRNTCRRSWSFL